jgi:hypothetical protein
MALLYGRTGCLTAENGGFRPPPAQEKAQEKAQVFASALARVELEVQGAAAAAVERGLGRIVALYDRASALYQIR